MKASPRQRQPENRWSLEEDEILLDAIEKCGTYVDWSLIALSIPGRDNKACRKRWCHSLDPTLRKGRWTEEEDKTLVSAVETHGTHWFKIAKLLPGRTDDQCAKRWRENLDPAISKRPWTAEEDKLLLDRFQVLGKRWKEIAASFEGRTPLYCRNRVLSLIRSGKKSTRAKPKETDVGGDLPSAEDPFPQGISLDDPIFSSSGDLCSANFSLLNKSTRPPAVNAPCLTTLGYDELLAKLVSPTSTINAITAPQLLLHRSSALPFGYAPSPSWSLGEIPSAPITPATSETTYLDLLHTGSFTQPQHSSNERDAAQTHAATFSSAWLF